MQKIVVTYRKPSGFALDDQWITIHPDGDREQPGRHILLSDDGYVKAGLGGVWNGKKFEKVINSGKGGKFRWQFPRSAYSKERVAAAVERSKSGKEMDKYLRPKAGKCWRAAGEQTKADIEDYTGSGFRKINDSGRKIGSGAYEKHGQGVYQDPVSLETVSSETVEKIKNITNYINGSSYRKDVLLYRGISLSATAKLLGNLDEEDLRTLTIKDIRRKFLGKTVTDHGFTSCGSSRDAGMDKDVKLEIYAPAGTKMAYLEPVSKWGGDYKYGQKWDGYKEAIKIGAEQETLLQRGTKFRIREIKRRRVRFHNYFNPKSKGWWHVSYIIRLDVVGCDPIEI